MCVRRARKFYFLELRVFRVTMTFNCSSPGVGQHEENPFPSSVFQNGWWRRYCDYAPHEEDAPQGSKGHQTIIRPVCIVEMARFDPWPSAMLLRGPCQVLLLSTTGPFSWPKLFRLWQKSIKIGWLFGQVGRNRLTRRRVDIHIDLSTSRGTRDTGNSFA